MGYRGSSPPNPTDNFHGVTLDPAQLQLLSVQKVSKSPGDHEGQDVGSRSDHNRSDLQDTPTPLVPQKPDAQSQSCSICLDPLYKAGATLRTLPCGHVFHVGCVDTWLIKWHGICPMCRMDLTTKRHEESNEARQGHSESERNRDATLQVQQENTDGTIDVELDVTTDGERYVQSGRATDNDRMERGEDQVSHNSEI
ncbi:hypothetical protein HDU93_002544 [Gonapodya sp. JEL0774]|nr:hypothetical protein HDU93_002544 [Gonapodya sp. JEL0774]